MRANGDSAADDEDAVRFCGLYGSATFANDTISGGLENNVSVFNTSGTLNRLTFTNSTLGLHSPTWATTPSSSRASTRAQ